LWNIFQHNPISTHTLTIDLFCSSPQFSPAFSEPPSPWPAPAADDTDQPSSYNQRSILKWEADEALGSNATISAVLYANMKHPELKRDYQSKLNYWPLLHVTEI